MKILKPINGIVLVVLNLSFHYLSFTSYQKNITQLAITCINYLKIITSFLATVGFPVVGKMSSRA